MFQELLNALASCLAGAILAAAVIVMFVIAVILLFGG